MHQQVVESELVDQRRRPPAAGPAPTPHRRPPPDPRAGRRRSCRRVAATTPAAITDSPDQRQPPGRGQARDPAADHDDVDHARRGHRPGEVAALLVHQVDDALQHRRVRVRRHPVTEVEHVAGADAPAVITARVRSATTGHGAPSRAGSRLPCTRVPVPSRRSASSSGSASPPRPRRRRPRPSRPSSSPVPTPKWIRGTPSRPMPRAPAAECGST